MTVPTDQHLARILLVWNEVPWDPQKWLTEEMACKSLVRNVRCDWTTLLWSGDQCKVDEIEVLMRLLLAHQVQRGKLPQYLALGRICAIFYTLHFIVLLYVKEK